MSCQPRPRAPRPEIDRRGGAPSPVPPPVRSATDALRVLLLATPPPLAAETLAFFLDDEGRGGVITIVSDTTDPSTVLPVAECLCRAAEGVPSATALVIASARPGGSVLAADGARWHELSRVAAEHGVRLLEWFVIGADGVHCPRELVGDPDRWSVDHRHAPQSGLPVRPSSAPPPSPRGPR